LKIVLSGAIIIRAFLYSYGADTPDTDQSSGEDKRAFFILGDRWKQEKLLSGLSVKKRN